MFRIVFDKPNWFTKKFPMFSHINVKSLEILEKDEDIDIFFKLLIMSNRTSKQTNKSRFNDFDNFFIEFIKNNKFTNISIHDVGVSSGITSLQFCKKLAEHNIKSKFFISDKHDRLKFCKTNILDAIFDTEDNLLYIYFLKIFFSDKVSNKFFTSHYGFRLLRTFCKQKNCKDIFLYHPEILKEINKKNIVKINFDIFKKNSQFKEKFDVVRIMNVLNLNYFSEKDIKKAILNISDSLKPNGFLIVGRTLPTSKNNVSIFKKLKQQFELVENFNDGSEISNIVLN